MDNLYIVESPLQALCALEISLGKENESNAIVVRISNGSRTRSDKQILHIINKREWDYKSVIKYNVYNNIIIGQLENRFSLSSIEKKFKGKVASLYIGEFRSSFMHMVRVAIEAPSVFLLDDGAVSVKVIDEYINKGQYYPFDSFYPKNKLKKIFFNSIYRKYIDFESMSKNIKVLTAFSDQESDNIESLKFTNIKDLTNEVRLIDNSLVYYYGSKYSEVGIISRDYEIFFLKGIKNFYDQRNKKIIYFAHRDESGEKLNYLSDQLKLEVIVPNIMAELYLLESNILPGEISGAYTSILNNAKVIFPEVLVRSFRLSSGEIGEKWRKDINLVYNYYERLNIEIEDISF